jgi:hypothetical protein
VIVVCPSCRGLRLLDGPCGVCGAPLAFPRRRSAPITMPLAPEAVREEVTARLRSVREDERPAPERVAFRWPESSEWDDVTTEVLPVGPFPGPAPTKE